MEVFCLTPQKTPISKILLGWLCLVLAIFCVMLSGLIHPMIMIVAIVFGFAFYFLALRGSIEYECSYFDGDIRFARIRAKSSRKNLPSYRIDDVVTIAPAGDRSVYRDENDKQDKVYIIGHKKPDSDTVCSAIAYADYFSRFFECHRVSMCVSGDYGIG